METLLRGRVRHDGVNIGGTVRGVWVIVKDRGQLLMESAQASYITLMFIWPYSRPMNIAVWYESSILLHGSVYCAAQYTDPATQYTDPLYYLLPCTKAFRCAQLFINLLGC